ILCRGGKKINRRERIGFNRADFAGCRGRESGLILLTASAEIQTGKTGAEQHDAYWFRNVGGTKSNHYTVVKEVTIRVESESNVVSGSDVTGEYGQLSRGKGVCPILGNVATLADHIERRFEQVSIVCSS